MKNFKISRAIIKSPQVALEDSYLKKLKRRILYGTSPKFERFFLREKSYWIHLFMLNQMNEKPFLKLDQVFNESVSKIGNLAIEKVFEELPPPSNSFPFRSECERQNVLSASFSLEHARQRFCRDFPPPKLIMLDRSLFLGLRLSSPIRADHGPQKSHLFDNLARENFYLENLVEKISEIDFSIPPCILYKLCLTLRNVEEEKEKKRQVVLAGMLTMKLKKLLEERYLKKLKRWILKKVSPKFEREVLPDDLFSQTFIMPAPSPSSSSFCNSAFLRRFLYHLDGM